MGLGTGSLEAGKLGVAEVVDPLGGAEVANNDVRRDMTDARFRISW